ncbi:MAG: ABC transporter ATP-binding protein [Nitrospira sp.]|jgi:ABC-2 type transport system ATP-binding protein|nr:ABC transporter ATP-binding protein [Nitrospira sp.]MDH4244507.1 ABC transporter ATP-binding protein [Nitrospira sp.]MDH4356987.1 ABC transporter ATP-binding protein [Nitrospira sp.]MDH5320597.1 ABC transporter ATP-binding protein [Nitrospira sp.]
MKMTREQIVRIEHLSKVFRVGFWGRRVTAVDDLSLEVQQGEIYGFLGPNGAGKTTTIKMLMGLIYPSSGAASLFGRSIGDQAAKAKVGFLPESPYFYDYLTSREFLRFYGHLFGLLGSALEKRIDELLELVGMTHARDLQLRKFSKGMLQRVGIAQAMINDPELVILDEPMSGLDPIGRKEVRDLILRLKESGKTVMFSSHILHDAELLCDRVAMIMKGRLVACGQVSELIDPGTTQEVEMVVDRLSPEGIEELRPFTLKTMLHGERVVATLASQRHVDDALEVIRSHQAKLVSLLPHKASLEDLFIRKARGVQQVTEVPA